MGRRAVPLPDDISLGEFQESLAKYPSIINEISDSKGAKNGQKTLAALDEYRYFEAPQTFGLDKQAKPMTLDDVKVLVEWKLRHGTFRPTLMKLVSSNDPTAVKDIIEEALEAYKADPSAPAALNVLTKLKGIGPATASLLLAVHDPERVTFFADEAFCWLCCDGESASIKYTAKEYQTLSTRAKKLAGRLGVKAVDVERVAYVLMKQGEDAPAKASGTARVPPSKPRSATKLGGDKAAKRKDTADNATESSGSLRRSKRGRQA